jgi:cytochrome bd-type quinol oxidase subunit 2
LTVDNAASGHHALTTALVWWPLGMLLAGVYFIFAYRMFFRTTPALADPAPLEPQARPGGAAS